jgi:hypothetical protein
MFEGDYIMENSSEYKLNIFENIYEWERDEFIKKLYIIE